MIERGVAVYQHEQLVEDILRAALNDPKESPKPIEGQMSVDDFPEAFKPTPRVPSPELLAALEDAEDSAGGRTGNEIMEDLLAASKEASGSSGTQ